MGVFGWLQADTVAAVWIAAAAIHREKNTVEAAAAAGLQPQQAAANKLHHFMFEFLLAILYTFVQCTSMVIIILLIHGSVTNEAMQKAGCPRGSQPGHPRPPKPARTR
jgi:hypothetical protein